MNRIALMVLKNLYRVPGFWFKLCAHAKNPDKYPEIERWNHIQKIMNAALKAGNVDLTVTGQENIPQKDGLLLVANHQGLFDVVALVTAWNKILCAVYKIELKNVLIFPEGTRSRNGNVMGDWHGGSFKCAVKAKATIQPFAVIDTYRVLDEKGSKPLRCQLHFLKPIPYEEYAGMKTNEIAAMVKARVQTCIDEHTTKNL